MWTSGNSRRPAPCGVSRILRIGYGNWLLHVAAFAAFRRFWGCVIVSGLRSAVMYFQVVMLFSLPSVLTTLRVVRCRAQGFMAYFSWTSSFHHPALAPVNRPEILCLSADRKCTAHLYIPLSAFIHEKFSIFFYYY